MVVKRTYVEHVFEILLVVDTDMSQIDHAELVGLVGLGIDVHVWPPDHEPPLDPGVISVLRVEQIPLLGNVVAINCRRREWTSSQSAYSYHER